MTVWSQQNPTPTSWNSGAPVPDFTFIVGSPIGMLLTVTHTLTERIFPAGPFTKQNPTATSWTEEVPS